MKELFPGFYPIGSDKIDVTAKTTLVAFDANVLLNLYRHPSHAIPARRIIPTCGTWSKASVGGHRRRKSQTPSKVFVAGMSAVIYRIAMSRASRSLSPFTLPTAFPNHFATSGSISPRSRTIASSGNCLKLISTRDEVNVICVGLKLPSWLRIISGSFPVKAAAHRAALRDATSYGRGW